MLSGIPGELTSERVRWSKTMLLLNEKIKIPPLHHISATEDSILKPYQGHRQNIDDKGLDLENPRERKTWGSWMWTITISYYIATLYLHKITTIHPAIKSLYHSTYLVSYTSSKLYNSDLDIW